MMGNMSVRVEFTCDEKDFREAHGTHHRGASKRGRAKSGWLPIARQIVLLLFTVVVLSFTLFAMFASTPSSSERMLPGGKTLVLRFLAASSLMLGFLVLWGAALIRMLVRPTRKPWETPTRGQRWKRHLLTLAVTIAVFWFILRVIDDAPNSGPARPTAYEVLLSIAPWFSVVVILSVFGMLQRRIAVRRSWASQPSLHRPHILEIDERELTINEPLSSHRYKWETFAGYRETENLFVLYVSPFAFWMVPKRAFLSEELQAFKSLLLTHVKQGLLLPIPGRFEVVPAAPVANVTPDRVTT